MEENNNIIKKLYLLIYETKLEIDMAKKNWWKNHSYTDITVLNKLTEVEDKLLEMMMKIEKKCNLTYVFY